MIDSLSELNDTLNKVVQRIVEESTSNTNNGKWASGWESVSDLISEQDYLLYFELIAGELQNREEVLDVDSSDHRLDVSCTLSYCPNYEWSPGDEEFFGCDKAQWERTFQAQPVTKPLSISRLSEIGKQAISYVLESSESAIEDLTESVGMSMAELKQLGIYDPTPEQTKDPIIFEVFDVQKVKTYPCASIEAALKTYKELGNSPFKFIAAAIPAGQPYSGRLMLLHQQDGKDILLNTETDTPAMQALHKHFNGTVVGNAFKSVEQYVRSQTPIMFTVWGAGTDDVGPPSFDTFEAAFAHYEKMPGSEKSISFLVYDQQGRGQGALLLNSDTLHGAHVCSLSAEAMNENPHIALAHAKATLALYPNDEKAWERRDQAEKLLGITDRVVSTFQDLFVGKWRVHVVPTGGHYGSHNHLVNEGEPLVHFYDTSAAPQAFGPEGQLVASYYVDTILGRDKWGKSEYPYGLSLNADVPQWTVSAHEMTQVIAYLNAMFPQEQTKTHPSPLLNRISNAESQKSPTAGQRTDPNFQER